MIATGGIYCDFQPSVCCLLCPRPGVLPHTPLTYSTYTAQLLCGVLVMGFISVISYRGCTTADKEQLSTCKCTATCTFLQVTVGLLGWLIESHPSPSSPLCAHPSSLPP